MSGVEGQRWKHKQEIGGAVNVHLSPSVWSQLERIINLTGCTKTWIVRRAISLYLEQYGEKNE